MTTISIIIPAYQEAKYIQKTFRSIKMLTRKPDEVIVVDGGSTDKTREIAKKFGAKVIIEKTRGIGLARNRGLKEATGDIIAYTDADTTVPPDWLTKIEESLKNPKAVGVYGIFKVLDGNIFYRLHIAYTGALMNKIYYYFGVLMAPGQNMAFKRKAGLKVGGFPENFKIAEDIEMMTRLKKIGEIVFRNDLVVISSGRRGKEGPQMIVRVFKAFFLYFFFKKANVVGFPDIR